MICIYSDSDIYGGVEVLVARYARYLAQRGIPFLVVESRGTMLAGEISDTNLISRGELRNYTSSIENVIFPAVSKLRDSRIDWLALKDAKITAWVVHPNETFRSFMPWSGQWGSPTRANNSRR